MLRKLRNLITNINAPEVRQIEKPKVLQFPVIDICNSRCNMCHIWKNKQQDTISPQELSNVLATPLYSEIESIGFNGGEPTLRSDLPELVEVAIDKLPKLRSVSLITNGYKHNDINAIIDSIGRKTHSKGISFDVMVSLDGIDQVHDKVRGRPGNFVRAQKVIQHTKDNPFVNNLRIGCTVTGSNVSNLFDLHDFCAEAQLYIKYRIGIPHQRLYTKNLIQPYLLNDNQKYQLIEFLAGVEEHYEKNPLQKFFYQSLIGQLAFDAPRKAGCDWRHRGITITSAGELAYCAVESDPIHKDIRSGNTELSYFENYAHLGNIIANKCDNCTHDYIGLPSGKQYRRMLVQHLKRHTLLRNVIPSLPFYTLAATKLKQSKFKRLEDEIALLPHVDPKIQSYSDSVLIIGWYGTETLGDKAILAGIVASIKKQYDTTPNIIVASLHPYVTKATIEQMENQLSGIEVVDINRAVSLSTSVNVVVFGGGPIMGIQEIAYMNEIFRRAKSSKTKTVIAGCGVGPLITPFHSKAITQLLLNSSHRIYRDEKSREVAKQLGVDTSRDTVCEDPAFTWLNKIPKNIRRTTGTKNLLLALRKLPANQYASHLTSKEATEIQFQFDQAILSSLTELQGRIPNLAIIPVPMSTNHWGSDDRWYYRELFRDSKGLNIDYQYIRNELTPEQYVEAFDSANALLAMRFHSLVFGLSRDINTIAVDYTFGRGKVYSLARLHAVPQFSMDQVKKEALIEQIEKALSKTPNASTPLTLNFSKALGSILK